MESIERKERKREGEAHGRRSQRFKKMTVFNGQQRERASKREELFLRESSHCELMRSILHVFFIDDLYYMCLY